MYIGRSLIIPLFIDWKSRIKIAEGQFLWLLSFLAKESNPVWKTLKIIPEYDLTRHEKHIQSI